MPYLRARFGRPSLAGSKRTRICHRFHDRSSRGRGAGGCDSFRVAACGCRKRLSDCRGHDACDGLRVRFRFAEPGALPFNLDQDVRLGYGLGGSKADRFCSRVCS